MVDFRSLYSPQVFQELAHGLVDQIAHSLEQSLAESRPVLKWNEPEVLRRYWADILKNSPKSLQPICAAILEQSITLHHPGYMGHQNAPVLPVAALADLIVSVLNSSSAIYEMGSATTMIEKAVVDWMNGHIGFKSGDGIFTSGGSLGNLTALLSARQAVTGRDVWHDGVAAGKPLCILASGFSHYSVRRAVQIMGLGREGLVGLAVDDRFRVVPAALESALDLATKNGSEVFAVVASSCNTALGTYDPLAELADFCEKHSLWLHVDGAHGASALLSQKYKNYLDGIGRADSVVWDAHKMLLMPALTSAVLFRDPKDSLRTFSQNASYLFEKSAEEEWYNLSHRTLECTKRAFALRLFLGLAVHGESIFGDYVAGQYDLAREFSKIVLANPNFELAVEPDSNIVCFRFLENGHPASDDIQRRLRTAVVRSGNYYLVQTDLPSGVFLRVTLMNPLTTTRHLEGLLEELTGLRRSI